MFSFFKKSSSNVQKNEKPSVTINYDGGTKFAINNTNDLYLDIEELGGFPFVKTVIIGTFSTNIKKLGCKLNLQFSNNSSITLVSDTTEVESNNVKNTNVFVTEIDFEMTESDASKIKTQKVTALTFTFKNTTLVFQPI